MADRVNASLNSETGSVRRYSHVRRWGAGLFVALLVTAASSSTAQAASVALGTADSFAVLAGMSVTNTGPSVISSSAAILV